MRKTKIRILTATSLFLLLFGLAASVVGANHTSSALASNALTTRGGSDDTILLVRGLNGGSGVADGSAQGQPCQGSGGYWTNVINYLRSPHSGEIWAGSIKTIGIYQGDSNCDAYLHDSSLTQHCANYEAGPKDAQGNDIYDGTNDESIYHLSCLLAWYIHDNYAIYPGKNVEIVAHSMGGMIVRNTIYQVQNHLSEYMPSTLGSISNVVTVETPHAGVVYNNSYGYLAEFACGGCKQVNQLAGTNANGSLWDDWELKGPDFLQEMIDNAQNPQTDGGTIWTLIGSTCDPAVSASSAMSIKAAHKVIYTGALTGDPLCYSHTSMLQENPTVGDVLDAEEYTCDAPAICDNVDEYSYASNWSYTENGSRFLSVVWNGLWDTTSKCRNCS